MRPCQGRDREFESRRVRQLITEILPSLAGENFHCSGVTSDLTGRFSLLEVNREFKFPKVQILVGTSPKVDYFQIRLRSLAQPAAVENAA